MSLVLTKLRAHMRLRSWVLEKNYWVALVTTVPGTILPAHLGYFGASSSSYWTWLLGSHFCLVLITEAPLKASWLLSGTVNFSMELLGLTRLTLWVWQYITLALSWPFFHCKPWLFFSPLFIEHLLRAMLWGCPVNTRDVVLPSQL